MSKKAMTWAFAQPMKSWITKFVLVTLGHYADERGVLSLSVNAIAEKACLDKKILVKALNRLKRAGLVEDTGGQTDVANPVGTYRLRMDKGVDNIESYPQNSP